MAAELFKTTKENFARRKPHGTKWTL